MTYIASKQNVRIKSWKKLHTAKGRQKAERYLIEGVHLVEEALKAAVRIETLIISTHFTLDFSVDSTIELVEVSEEVVKELSLTPTPQGIFAVCELPKQLTVWEPIGTHYLLVDAVQDPGNLGTIIRTADAAGYDGILLGEGTVDVYNDKVLRSTQGSLWHLEILNLPLEEAVSQLQAHGIPVYATALHQEAIDYREIQQSQCAIIVGNEGQGVRQSLIDQSDASVYIPMKGKAESLNVAVATGILLFSTH